MLPLPALAELGEPAANALFQFPGGATGALLTMGRRDVLIFEADVVGEAGRLLVSHNGDHVSLTPFVPSPSFVGYRVPSAPIAIATQNPAESPFVELARAAAALARGGVAASADGPDALRSESIVEAIIASCREGEAG